MRPISLVDSGGIAITEAENGEPMTPVDAPLYGEPMTLVASGGIPVVLVNDNLSPRWVPSTAIYYADFLGDRYYRLDSGVIDAVEAYSFERSTVALGQNSSGVWVEAAIDELRINDTGITYEDEQTYYPVNSASAGAATGEVTGVPVGALPTGWSLQGGGWTSVIVVSFGVDDDGLNQITLDLVSDRTATTQAFPQLYLNSVSAIQIAATEGESITGAFWYDVVSRAGDDTVSDTFISVSSRAGSGGATLNNSIIGLRNTAGSDGRVAATHVVPATADRALMRWQATVPAGGKLNRRVTIKMPTVQKGAATLTSPLSTTNSGTAFRGADALTLSLPETPLDLTLDLSTGGELVFNDVSGEYLVPHPVSATIAGATGWQ